MSETAPELTVHDEMIERAARAWWAHESDSDVAWSDVDEAVQRTYLARAEQALYAAFEGVPMSNYSIGTLLKFFSHVICVKGSGTAVFVPNGTDDGFDSLAHSVRFTYRKNGALSTLMFSKMGDGDGS